MFIAEANKALKPIAASWRGSGLAFLYKIK
jgi:hypothetical protein